jgi:hypothetical protein
MARQPEDIITEPTALAAGSPYRDDRSKSKNPRLAPSAHISAMPDLKPHSEQRRLVLLGPQPEYQSLRHALTRLKIDSPVALITAGWEDDESDPRKLTPLMDALPAGSFNLDLFQRTEDLFKVDPALIQALRDRQDELRILRDLYRSRLELALEAARITNRRRSDRLDFAEERLSAIEAVQLLDRQYFVRTCQICDAWEERMKTSSRPHVIRHTDEVRQSLSHVSAIVIGGGHAAIILNRLKIFEILESSVTLPVVAWSGGAMALADQIVFFHDSPPQGRGDAELLRAGMGMFDKILPLPDARNRLMLDDPEKVSLFANRFDRYQCVVFDEHTMLDRENGRWSISAEAQKLGVDGLLKQVSA